MSIPIGDVRAEFEAKLREQLAEIMAKKAADGVHSFYILVYAAWVDTDKLRTRFMLMKQRPVPMLGTCCYKVEDGRLFSCWVLPRDNYLIPDAARDADGIVGVVESGAKKLSMPIVN